MDIQILDGLQDVKAATLAQAVGQIVRFEGAYQETYTWAWDLGQQQGLLWPQSKGFEDTWHLDEWVLDATGDWHSWEEKEANLQGGG
jgi:hypothetical protein